VGFRVEMWYGDFMFDPERLMPVTAKLMEDGP